MATRLKAIILRRKPAGDESLYLDTLLENGEFGAFRIPGILKSAKRSSFHYAPGGIYDIIFHGSTSLTTGPHRIVPKSSELIFSPFKDTQDYKTLAAVAEIVQTAEFVKSSGDSGELFSLIASALMQMPTVATELDRHLDAYYWNFLGFLGLAGDPDEDEVYEAYDLTSGFLTAHEKAERPKGDFTLPFGWVTGAGGIDSAACREIIRKYLKNL
jgi:recombinational DNA repair protein (RecF pathway)